MKEKKIKIGYISSSDPRDKISWSGTHYSIWKALLAQGAEIELLGPANPRTTIVTGKIITGVSLKIFGKRYNYLHSKMLAKCYAKIFEKKLEGKYFDLIIAPASATEVAYLKTKIPIVIIADTTVAISLNYHKSLSNLFGFSIKETFEVEQMALNRASLIVYSSDWAASSAIRDYNISSSNVCVIPFGANIESVPRREDVIKKNILKKCKLLFVGTYWENKGGPVAYETFIHLLKCGIDAELTVCGCVPNISHPKMTVIPFLDKNK
ncbi:MAG: hypothetical protein V1781_02475, partial [Bacteroidota bacterium]